MYAKDQQSRQTRRTQLSASTSPSPSPVLIRLYISTKGCKSWLWPGGGKKKEVGKDRLIVPNSDGRPPKTAAAPWRKHAKKKKGFSTLKDRKKTPVSLTPKLERCPCSKKGANNGKKLKSFEGFGIGGFESGLRALS